MGYAEDGVDVGGCVEPPLVEILDRRFPKRLLVNGGVGGLNRDSASAWARSLRTTLVYARHEDAIMRTWFVNCFGTGGRPGFFAAAKAVTKLFAIPP